MKKIALKISSRGSFNLSRQPFANGDQSKVRAGFTIVELVIVVVVVAILAAITYVSYTSIMNNNTKETIKSSIQSTAAMVNKYESENDRYPTVAEYYNMLAVIGRSLADIQYTSTSTSYCITGSLDGIYMYADSDSIKPRDGRCAGH